MVAAVRFIVDTILITTAGRYSKCRQRYRSPWLRFARLCRINFNLSLPPLPPPPSLSLYLSFSLLLSFSLYARNIKSRNNGTTTEREIDHEGILWSAQLVTFNICLQTYLITYPLTRLHRRRNNTRPSLPQKSRERARFISPREKTHGKRGKGKEKNSW